MNLRFIPEKLPMEIAFLGRSTGLQAGEIRYPKSRGFSLGPFPTAAYPRKKILIGPPQ
jgi:hypothetical protein